MKLLNPHTLPNPDYFFHLGYSTTDDIAGLFGDVSRVALATSQQSSRRLAEELAKSIGQKTVEPIGLQDRFLMFKVGTTFVSSTGVGNSSISILLQELNKMLVTAGCKDVEFIRIGYGLGIGVDASSVVIPRGVINGKFAHTHNVISCGKMQTRLTLLDPALPTQLSSNSNDSGSLPPLAIGVQVPACIQGGGQVDKAHLRMLALAGGRVVSYDAGCFSAFCTKLGIRAAMVIGITRDLLKDGEDSQTRCWPREAETRAMEQVAAYF